MERRLGRGLGSLISQPEPEASSGPAEISLEQIRPNPFQPRETFDPAGIEELRTSIENHGILQPVVVRRAAEGFELISGERRWRAAGLAGLQTLPAIIRQADDDEMLELALVENVQRRDLNALEKARGYRAMMDALELTQEGVASRVGLRRSTVTNHLRLLDLPPSVQEAVAQGLISMGHARAILGLSDAASQINLMEETVRDGLSVREVEHRVRDASLRPKHGADSEPRDARPSRAAEQPAWARQLESRLRERLGTKVTLTNGPDYRGQIVIEYYNREDLERLIDELCPSRSLD